MSTKHRQGKLGIGIIILSLLCYNVFGLQEIALLIGFFSLLFFAETLDYMLYLTGLFGISWKKSDQGNMLFRGDSLEKFPVKTITLVVRNGTISVNGKQTHTSDDTYALYGRSFENKCVDIVLEKQNTTTFLMKQSTVENMKESEKREVYSMVCDVLSAWRKNT